MRNSSHAHRHTSGPISVPPGTLGTSSNRAGEEPTAAQQRSSTRLDRRVSPQSCSCLLNGPQVFKEAPVSVLCPIRSRSNLLPAFTASWPKQLLLLTHGGVALATRLKETFSNLFQDKLLEGRGQLQLSKHASKQAVDGHMLHTHTHKSSVAAQMAASQCKEHIS